VVGGGGYGGSGMEEKQSKLERRAPERELDRPPESTVAEGS
jgi:hypothetical protein